MIDFIYIYANALSGQDRLSGLPFEEIAMAYEWYLFWVDRKHVFRNSRVRVSILFFGYT